MGDLHDQDKTTTKLVQSICIPTKGTICNLCNYRWYSAYLAS